MELSASGAALRVGAGGSEPTHSIIYELHKAGIQKVHVCSKFITIPHRKKGGIIRQYSEQIVCKQIRQPRMNTFLETNKAITQEEENLNPPTTNKECGLVIRKLPVNKPVPDGFTGEFYPAFREELT